ncbi:MAG: hypothetical protein H0V07_07770, partial [Propionibacteriales bacterium]|nr:hypothetical protein [Propionibacteriales bacterium]
MSGPLKDLLAERARAAEPPRLDVGAVIESGNARLRRRRIALGTGTAGAVLAVMWAGSLVSTSETESDPGRLQPAAAAFADRQVTYALGSTIHYGDQRMDVAPYEVSTFVQTDSGFVFTDKAGEVVVTDGEATD